MRNFRTLFLLGTDGSDGLAVDLGHLADGPIRLLRLRLNQLGDQLAFLFGGEVPAVDVLGNDIGSHTSIVVLLVRGDLAARRVGIYRLAEILFLVSARVDSKPLKRAVTIAAVDDLALVEVESFT